MPPAVSRSLSEWSSTVPLVEQYSMYPLMEQMPVQQVPQQQSYMHQDARHVMLSSAALSVPDFSMMPYDDSLTAVTPSLYSPLQSPSCSNLQELLEFQPYVTSRSILDAVDVDDDMSAVQHNLSNPNLCHKRIHLTLPECWATKPIRKWSKEDVAEWLQNELHVPANRLREINFEMTGEQLVMLEEMCLNDLENDLRVELRRPLAEIAELEMGGQTSSQQFQLHEHNRNATLPSYESVYEPQGRLQIVKEEDEDDGTEYPRWSHPAGHSAAGYSAKQVHHSSDSEDGEDEREAIAARGRPGRRGRPPSVTSKTARRKLEKRHGRLWEFIRDLLKNPEYCPSLICWENHDEGVFRFVSSEKVAQLWGSKRGNTKMTYEKLSRAMRYYYKSNILQPVTHRRLVYRFGPNATNWRHPNPNFRRPV